MEAPGDSARAGGAGRVESKWSPLALAAMLALGLAIPTALFGGWAVAGRMALVAFAAAALSVAVAFAQPASLREAARNPITLVLASLGAVTLASAVWTLGPPVDAAVWGLALVGLGALVITGGVIATRPGGELVIATAVGLLAIGNALVGLFAVVTRDPPLATQIAGGWRAAGAFEYVPALAALQVFALPALLLAMARGRRALSTAAAIAVVLAAQVVGLSSSRVQLSLGAALLIALVVLAPRLLARSRLWAACVALTAIVAGLAAQAIVGAYDQPYDFSTQPAELAALAGLALAGGLLWALLWKPPDAPESPGKRRGLAAVAIALLVASAVLAPGTEIENEQGPYVQGTTDVTHGRIEIWSEAIDGFAERPLLGAGAETHLPASAEGQGISVQAHSLPLELVAELGALGLILGVALYASAGLILWRARGTQAAWLFGPGAAALLLASLVDVLWHSAALGASGHC